MIDFLIYSEEKFRPIHFDIQDNNTGTAGTYRFLFAEKQRQEIDEALNEREF